MLHHFIFCKGFDMETLANEQLNVPLTSVSCSVILIKPIKSGAVSLMSKIYIMLL